MERQSKIECPAGIYKILNKETGTAYIGQTSIDLEGRWKSHESLLKKGKHKNPYFQRAWDTYGADAFIASVEMFIKYEQNVEEFYESLDREEIRILKLYPDHYNLMEAGEDRMIFSEESRTRASYSAKNRKITPEERAVWESNRLAAVRSLKSREKRSEAHKRMWEDPFYREHLVTVYNSPEVVKKKSEGIKASFTSERRATYGKESAERWNDPEFRKKTIESITTARNNPVSKELYSTGISKGWLKRKADPLYEIKNQERIAKIKATRARKKAEKLLPTPPED